MSYPFVSRTWMKAWCGGGQYNNTRCLLYWIYVFNFQLNFVLLRTLKASLWVLLESLYGDLIGSHTDSSCCLSQSLPIQHWNSSRAGLKTTNTVQKGELNMAVTSNFTIFSHNILIFLRGGWITQEEYMYNLRIYEGVSKSFWTESITK